MKVETAKWLVGCSFGVSGVLFWGKRIGLKRHPNAPIDSHF